jgi:hypothetical protein
MSATENPSIQNPGQDFTKTWRYKVGLFLIIVSNLDILVGVLLGFVGVGATTIGAILVGGEILTLVSIVLLGKEGFKAVKNKVAVFARSTYTAPVGKTRHYIGIALLLTNVVTTYLMMLYAWDAFDAAVAEGPTAAVWGLDIEQQGSLVLHLFMIGELSFLIGIYVMGADWWGKFRRIFVWEAP